MINEQGGAWSGSPLFANKNSKQNEMEIKGKPETLKLNLQ